MPAASSYKPTSLEQEGKREQAGGVRIYPCKPLLLSKSICIPEMCEGMRVAWEEDFLAVSLLSLFLGNFLGNDKRGLFVFCFFLAGMQTDY